MADTSESRLAAAIASARADAARRNEALQVAATREARILVAVGLFFVGYLSWAFVRIAPLADPVQLAKLTSDIAIGRVLDIIADARQSAPAMAPAVVREVEGALVDVIPEARREVEQAAIGELREIIGTFLAHGDTVFVEELSRMPEARAIIAKHDFSNENVARLVQLGQQAIVKRPDVAKDLDATQKNLAKLREHVRKLAANQGLTPLEQAERRLLQVLFASHEPKPAERDARGAKPAVAPAKHKRGK